MIESNVNKRTFDYCWLLICCIQRIHMGSPLIRSTSTFCIHSNGLMQNIFTIFRLYQHFHLVLFRFFHFLTIRHCRLVPVMNEYILYFPFLHQFTQATDFNRFDRIWFQIQFCLFQILNFFRIHPRLNLIWKCQHYCIFFKPPKIHQKHSKMYSTWKWLKLFRQFVKIESNLHSNGDSKLNIRCLGSFPSNLSRIIPVCMRFIWATKNTKIYNNFYWNFYRVVSSNSQLDKLIQHKYKYICYTYLIIHRTKQNKTEKKTGTFIQWMRMIFEGKTR